MREEPRSLKALEARVRNLAKAQGKVEKRVFRAVVNTVVGQMLPSGVIKGGTAMKLRVGEEFSRFTPDLDAARAANVLVDPISTEPVVQACREAGFDVPNQVVVAAAFDGPSGGTMTSITAMDLNPVATGQLATTLLIDIIEGRSPEGPIIVPAALRVRESSKREGP